MSAEPVVVESQILRAAWVASMDGPPIRAAAVAFAAGRITDVGPAPDVVTRHPQAAVRDLGDVLLTPGLVNAHTHLELSDLTPGPPPASFADWLISLMSSLFAAGPEAAAESAARATRAGIEQCLRFGVTTVGDVTSRPAATRPILSGATSLRATSFGEVRAMAERRGLLEGQVAAAVDLGGVHKQFRVGVSPHSPYTVEPEGYRTCLARAGARAITTHLAETPDEADFLRDHSGPLRRVWDWRGGWDDSVPTFDGGPIRFAKAVGLLDKQTLLAHVNYCDDGELALLAAGQASVAYCPRTHAYFRHPPHRWRDMLALGINVCFGTDSRASSPDLNLLDDVRLLHRLAPEVPATTLWEMATWRGARAIRRSSIGKIRLNQVADLVAFPIDTCDDPLAAVLESDVTPSACWVGGRLVFALGVGVSHASYF